MPGFVMRFFLCNIFISAIIGIFLMIKRLLRKSLSSRMQYHLWFALLGLMAVPFLPCRPLGLMQVLSWVRDIASDSGSVENDAFVKTAVHPPSEVSNWMEDFTLSVSSKTYAATELILCGIWTAGVLLMSILAVRAYVRLRTVKNSALPLQNPDVSELYRRCLSELSITKDIRVYSTAFLKSPVITGFLSPRIYIPIHLISDYNAVDMRYMLLHELQHYKHKDALAGYVMNLAGMLYWFNPLVWYALKEMRDDREIACDTSVLQMLGEGSCEAYGVTLIHFAEKVSRLPFPFVSGIGGNIRQLHRRIQNIASYERPTFRQRWKSFTAFALTTALLFAFSPIVSTYAADDARYSWDTSSEPVRVVDLSSFFGSYEGSFVLYDSKNGCWHIHDRERATFRTSPNSTYKIYDALFGLEEGLITPDNSYLAWDKVHYPITAWNTDQTLSSAMRSSVNWYFQEIDRQLGGSRIRGYIDRIHYGNEHLEGGLSSYWMESSLKISPVEQVMLLKELHESGLGFSSENVRAVKDSLFLFTSEVGDVYGKTGTGRIDGLDVNGWFVGYVERSGHTCFFAVNIAAESGATGSRASEIALSILSGTNIG